MRGVGDEKQSFVLYTSTDDLLDLLSDEQAGRLIKAIFKYEKGQPLPDMDGMTKVAFASVKSYLDKDSEKYFEVRRKRQEGGGKGGRPRKQSAEEGEKPQGSSENLKVFSEPNGFQENLKVIEKPQGSSENHELFSKPVSASVSASESVYDSVSVSGSVSDIDRDTSNKSISRSGNGDAAPTGMDLLVDIPLPNGKSWRPDADEYERMRESYPSLDIVTEFNLMRAWCQRGEGGCYSGASVSGFAWRWLERESQSRARQEVTEERKRKGSRSSADIWEDLARRVDNGEFG